MQFADTYIQIVHNKFGSIKTVPPLEMQEIDWEIWLEIKAQWNKLKRKQIVVCLFSEQKKKSKTQKQSGVCSQSKSGIRNELQRSLSKDSGEFVMEEMNCMSLKY